jgi:hypothetical protein
MAGNDVVLEFAYELVSVLAIKVLGALIER